MDSMKNIIKILVVSIIATVIVLLLFFNSDKVIYNLIGIIIVICIEVFSIKNIKDELKHDLPDSPDKRADIIKTFMDKFNIRISYADIITIVEATYYSKEWEKELEAMTNDYANLGMWFTTDGGRKNWLRIYLACFPVKEISGDMEEQHDLIVNKHFVNLYKDIISREFLTNEEIIRYINEKFYLTFDKNSFAIWKAYMKKNGYDIPLKNDGQVGFDTEINRLKRNYSDK